MFNAGPIQTTRTLDVATQAWETVGNSNYGYRGAFDPTAVTLQPGKSLTIGGNDPASDTTEIIDLNQSDPK